MVFFILVLCLVVIYDTSSSSPERPECPEVAQEPTDCFADCPWMMERCDAIPGGWRSCPAVPAADPRVVWPQGARVTSSPFDRNNVTHSMLALTLLTRLNSRESTRHISAFDLGHAVDLWGMKGADGQTVLYANSRVSCSATDTSAIVQRGRDGISTNCGTTTNVDWCLPARLSFVDPVTGDTRVEGLWKKQQTYAAYLYTKMHEGKFPLPCSINSF